MDAIWNIFRKYYFPTNIGYNLFFCNNTYSLILRIFKKDFLKIKKNKIDTFWVKKDNSNNNMNNQF